MSDNKCTGACCAGSENIIAEQMTDPLLINGVHYLQSTYMIAGLDCLDCVAKLEKKIAGLSGVLLASINFHTGKMIVKHTLSEAAIIQAVEQAGYQVQKGKLHGVVAPQTMAWWKEKKSQPTLAAGVLLAAATGLDWIAFHSQMVVALYVTVIVIGGYHTGKSGIYSLLARTFDMNFLMTVAVIGAMAIGEWSEAATVAFLFSVGNSLQAYTIDKTRNSIRALMELAPLEALVIRQEQEQRLPVEEIMVGEIILIKPGERIAMDGIIQAGASAVNQATITGESVAVDKTIGDAVYAGTLNEDGVLEVEVTKLAADSTLAKIMHLVEEAQAKKAPSQQLVDVFAKYYTPIVLLIALGIMMIPWLFFSQSFAEWFYKGLVLLVISCPCALVISTPVALVSAIGNASQNGVLIKGGIFLEQLGYMNAIAFDKTGTLTEGRPRVAEVVSLSDCTSQELLITAASIEKWFEHPVAAAIVEKANGLPLKPAFQCKALFGKGAQGDVDGKTYYIGNLRLFEEIGVNVSSCREKVASLQQQGNTAIIIATQDELLGIIAVADTLRGNSQAAMQEIRNTGMKHMAMLTGDNQKVAEGIASQLSLDAVYSELLPEEKVTAVQNIISKYGNVIMVGDGVNDAPALSAASVSVAMGVAGSDTALETADITLMSDDLNKIAFAIQLSRKTVGIIKQNIGFAILIKVAFVAFTFAGAVNLWLAVFADMGSSILVTLNGMRLMRSVK